MTAWRRWGLGFWGAGRGWLPVSLASAFSARFAVLRHNMRLVVQPAPEPQPSCMWGALLSPKELSRSNMTPTPWSSALLPEGLVPHLPPEPCFPLTSGLKSHLCGCLLLPWLVAPLRVGAGWGCASSAHHPPFGVCKFLYQDRGSPGGPALVALQLWTTHSTLGYPVLRLGCCPAGLPWPLGGAW